jgi:hypothetical protein
MTATELAQVPASTPLTRRRWLRPYGALLAAQLVTGLLIGVLWRLWAPSSVSYLVSNDAGRAVVIPDESEAQIAGDGRYVLLSLLAGLLFGLFAWTVRRYRGPAMAAVLAAGSLAGSVLAMATGRLLSGGTGSPALNTAFHPRLTLHSSAALFLQAFIAVLAYTVLAGMSRDPALGLPASDGSAQAATDQAVPEQPPTAHAGADSASAGRIGTDRIRPDGGSPPTGN